MSMNELSFLKDHFENRILLINQLLINKSDNIVVEFFRYIFVGGIAFLVDLRYRQGRRQGY